MLNSTCFITASAVMLFSAQALTAELYEDPTGDTGPGDSNLDLTEISVTNDADYLFVDITTVSFADWAKYMVFFDYADGGITGNSNPWFRNVDMGSNGIDAFAGIWANGGGGSQTFTNDGTNWSETGGGSVQSISGSTVSLQFSLNAFGIGVGDVVKFDIGTSGGNNGDPATDLVSVGSIAGNWGGQATAGELRSYTIVPTPGALALLGLAGLTARRRRA